MTMQEAIDNLVVTLFWKSEPAGVYSDMISDIGTDWSKADVRAWVMRTFDSLIQHDAMSEYTEA